MYSTNSRCVALVALLMLLFGSVLAMTDSGRASLAQQATEMDMASFPKGGSIVVSNRVAGVSDYLYEGDINLTEKAGLCIVHRFTTISEEPISWTQIRKNGNVYIPCVAVLDRKKPGKSGAPAGKKVQVQVTVMKGVLCLNGCWTQGIEFKTLAAKAITNPRSCCAGQLKQVITSNLNPTPVINYNLYLQSEITYLYRYI
nr:C. briggsae CBR-NAS-17 protein [Haemonchus contortus]